jgi:hypothetical protein
VNLVKGRTSAESFKSSARAGIGRVCKRVPHFLHVRADRDVRCFLVIFQCFARASRGVAVANARLCYEQIKLANRFLHAKLAPPNGRRDPGVSPFGFEENLPRAKPSAQLDSGLLVIQELFV